MNMDVQEKALVLACSPRAGGNSDTIAAIAGREPPGATVLHLRGYPVLPCISCGYCTAHPGGPCPQGAKDASRALFAAMREAASLTVVSPIYFYHLPSQFKAFIDRAQPLWTLCNASGGFPSPTRRAGIILLAGRKSGTRLFEGSILTLRLWLKLFGFTPADPLELYGLDAPGDAAASDATREAVRRYMANLTGGQTGEPLRHST